MGSDVALPNAHGPWERRPMQPPVGAMLRGATLLLAVTVIAVAPPKPGGVIVPVPSDKPVQPTLADDKDAIEAAKKWLALLDAGQYGEAWDLSSAQLKSAVTRQKWITGVRDARKPFGKLKSRTEERFARAHSMPNGPDGDYAVVDFKSSFANGKKATEQLVWFHEDDQVWRIAGYYIQ
jgi:hypothetical protein